MKKRTIVLILLLIIILGLVGYRRYFYQFKVLGKATLFSGPIESPEGEYNARAYYIPYGGAAGGVMYLVEVEQTKTGVKKIIYSSEHKDKFSMDWQASDILSITNESPEYKEYRNIELKVNTEIYEESGSACRSLLLKDQYETCYQDVKE
ncbi:MULTISPECIES: DUF5412 family protein [Paenibacillus]|uniref:Uncharacterized protein n=1 Tax=Paenibacillus borealis TaxID=160799 RepID=A0ABX3H4K9_PAEBO|nr:DUF5412 family protein [Paenibacillus borealis]OMD45352.1 hypothetical protein BSK56_19720 [Paenibacillus borealis]